MGTNNTFRAGALVTPALDDRIAWTLAHVYEYALIALEKGISVVRTNETSPEYERGYAQGQKDEARLVISLIRDNDDDIWQKIAPKVYETSPTKAAKLSAALLAEAARVVRAALGPEQVVALEYVHALVVHAGILNAVNEQMRAHEIAVAREDREVRKLRAVIGPLRVLLWHLTANDREIDEVSLMNVLAALANLDGRPWPPETNADATKGLG